MKLAQYLSVGLRFTARGINIKYMVPTENVQDQLFFDSKNPNDLVVQQNELLSFRSIELLK